MITIEEAARQHCNRSQFKSDFPHDYHSEESGFKAGVEFAQRWISVEEELPQINEYVLFKYSEGELCVGCLNVYGYYCSTYDPKENDNISIHLLSEVTHWRPIELK